MLYRDYFNLNRQLHKEEVMIQLGHEGIHLPDEDVDVVWHEGFCSIWVLTKTESYMHEVKAAVERINAFLELVDRIEATQRMHRSHRQE